MARVIEIVLWVVFAGALLWLGAALLWHFRPSTARRATALFLIPMIEKVRALLRITSFNVLTTATPISLDDIAAAILEHLRSEVLEPPVMRPEQGLISWNIPKNLPTASWRRVQVRVSRGSVHTADHRAGLKGGPPAYTKTIAVGTRMAVRLHTKDPDLQIDDLQVDAHTNARERDLPDQQPRHWDFQIRSDTKGWRELSLIATPLKPVRGDQFEEPLAIEMTWTRLGAWQRNLPTNIKWAMRTALVGLVGIISTVIVNIATPYIQEQACSRVPSICPQEPAKPGSPPDPNQ